MKVKDLHARLKQGSRWRIFNDGVTYGTVCDLLAQAPKDAEIVGFHKKPDGLHMECATPEGRWWVEPGGRTLPLLNAGTPMGKLQ